MHYLYYAGFALCFGGLLARPTPLALLCVAICAAVIVADEVLRAVDAADEAEIPEGLRDAFYGEDVRFGEIRVEAPDEERNPNA